MRTILALSLVITMGYSSVACAGGLIGDFIEGACGNCGAGKALDKANDDAKKAVPIYKSIEEGATGGVKKAVEEFNAEVHGPMLAAWIEASKADVINAGVSPIPPQIMQGLSGYFPQDLLSSVRYRSGWGNELALPALAFEFGDAAAITLGDVVMFRDQSQADTDLTIWAHELTHVGQYRDWGTLDFAKRYIKDHNGVEAAAYNNAAQFNTWYSQRQQAQVPQQRQFPQQVPQQFPQQYPQQFPQQQQAAVSGICRVGPNQFDACVMNNGMFPLGSSCSCMTQFGPRMGFVNPN
ncbi:eCIS core domain-containing protein [Rhizobium leguminosarum]|uniref:eCIS core domain-containing protein n=1 Tax=Rhizobium leguminosarum TaxID=384 RepID=UPI001039EAE9|nr:DUF4157 domain-containing protein [Rhizobium leguminosarum]TBY48341.1 DUF4157 domain-containing protein [Rhizobium leguminosarum bv. viciae]